MCGEADSSINAENTSTTLSTGLTLEAYEKGWKEKFEIFPILTKNEFDKSIDFFQSYQVSSENFPFLELEIIVDKNN